MCREVNRPNVLRPPVRFFDLEQALLGLMLGDFVEGGERLEAQRSASVDEKSLRP